ncbi:hypothetical protein EPN83_02855 [Patescibacteria group bacterium]|nr:MAG: hypothetical protein EPN83_02855 [Patescibacteria group bacterium]
MGAPDYRYALDFLNRFNRSEYNGNFLSDQFFLGRYNIWYFFQTSLFVEILRFSGSRETPKQLRLSPSGFFISLFLFCASFLSLLWFSIFRKKVLIFSVDSLTSRYKSDFRIQGLYAFLAGESVSFAEIFHTVPGRESLKRFWGRLRPALYLEAIDFLFFLACWLFPRRKDIAVGKLSGDFGKDEAEFAGYLAEKYKQVVPLSLFRIRALSRILRWLKPRAVFTIDDTRHYNELLVAAQLNQIPSIALQHGHFSKYHVGWLRRGFPGEPATPNALCVWSEYWKNELDRLGSVFPEDTIFVAGMPTGVANQGSDHRQRKRGQKITVMIPFETNATVFEVRSFLDAFRACRGVEIIFKIRPDRDEKDQLAAYGLTSATAQVVRDVSEIIEDVDVVGGVYSTFLYDMVALGKPVFIMKTSMDYGEGMLVNKLADPLSLSRPCEQLEKIARTSPAVITRRRERLVGEHPPDFLKSLRDLALKYGII